MVELMPVRRRLTPVREVVCPSCGQRRTVSDRQARRGTTLCKLCRYPHTRLRPEDKDRRFWLERFSDEEILDLALGVFGHLGSISHIRAWRRKLLKDGL